MLCCLGCGFVGGGGWVLMLVAGCVVCLFLFVNLFVVVLGWLLCAVVVWLLLCCFGLWLV